jgi:hypothetical protein
VGALISMPIKSYGSNSSIPGYESFPTYQLTRPRLPARCYYITRFVFNEQGPSQKQNLDNKINKNVCIITPFSGNGLNSLYYFYIMLLVKV